MTYSYAKVSKKNNTFQSYNVASLYMICLDRDVSKRLHNTQGKLVRGFHFFTEKQASFLYLVHLLILALVI